MTDETKTCNACATEKPLTEFGMRQAGGKMYPRTKCRNCRAAEVRDARAADPKKFRTAANETRRNYFAKNPEKRASAKYSYRKNQPGMFEVKRFQSKMKNRAAMPAWADRKAMAQFYAVAAARRAGGEDVTVDHAIPLNHDLVCGLHNQFNLQFLTFMENVVKSNKFEIE